MNILPDGIREIQLTRGKVALVDATDFKYLSSFKWFFDNNYAARRIKPENGKPKLLPMHRVIWLRHFPDSERFLLDHANGNKLDNRLENLRLATRSQNSSNKNILASNKSGFKGVYYRKSRNTWAAYITFNYKTTWLGTYKTPEEAAKAYDIAATKAWGEFASLNFPSTDCL